MKRATIPRWRRRLEKELAFRSDFDTLTAAEWQSLLETRSVTSSNHDTVLSLDWPHYCAFATRACGGPEGWCYTFQGNQASALHNRHAAMVDALATNEPAIFGERVESEVQRAVRQGAIPYPNLRFAGSGELVDAHLPALANVAGRGIKLWGFTRNLRLAKAVRELGAAVIFSCDRTSAQETIDAARTEGLPLAYSSSGVLDIPPSGTLVTFPVHRVGRVREVVDVESLCPKVLADFFDDARPAAFCQKLCHRCHIGRGSS